MHTAPPPQERRRRPAQASKDSRANRSTPPDPVREPPCLSAPARPLRVRHGVRNQHAIWPRRPVGSHPALLQGVRQRRPSSHRTASTPRVHLHQSRRRPDRPSRVLRSVLAWPSVHQVLHVVGPPRTPRMPWSDTGRPSSTDQGSATSSTSNSPTARYRTLTSTSGRNSADRARPGSASVSGLVPATSRKTSDEVIAYLESARIIRTCGPPDSRASTPSTAQFRITRKST